MSVGGLVLREKNAKLLVILKETEKKWYASNIARKVELSYVYVTMLLNELQKDGVVEFKREKKIKQVVLTEKGMKIANALDELMARLAVEEETAVEEKKI